MILGQWSSIGIFGANASLVFDVLESTNISYRVSGRDLFKQSLAVDKSNTFTLTLGDWLGSEAIDSITVASAGVTVLSSGLNDASTVIGVNIQGDTQGRYPVHFSWETVSGRSGCMDGYVDVRGC